MTLNGLVSAIAEAIKSPPSQPTPLQGAGVKEIFYFHIPSPLNDVLYKGRRISVKLNPNVILALWLHELEKGSLFAVAKHTHTV